VLTSSVCALPKALLRYAQRYARFGLAPVRIGLWHRGFIGMQHRALAQQLGEAPPERFQGDAGTAHFVAIRTQ
jgi:hypothetical protein